MNRKKVGVLSIVLAFAMFIAMTTETNAWQWWTWDSDSDSGDYIFIKAYASGNFHQGKLYSPNAYIYVEILEDSPDDDALVVYWRFEWVDLNFERHYYFDTEDFPNIRYKGQSKKFDPPADPPNPVYIIWTEGRAGYDGEWDTRKVLASVPLTPRRILAQTFEQSTSISSFFS